MKLKKLTPYTPKIKEAANILYLKDADGNDWYESQEKFNPARLKIAYTDDGVIRSADYDVSALWPVNMSVAELDPAVLPKGLKADGIWKFDGNAVYQDSDVPGNKIYERNIRLRDKYLTSASLIVFTIQCSAAAGNPRDGDNEQLLQLQQYVDTLRDVDLSQVSPAWPTPPDIVH